MSKKEVLNINQLVNKVKEQFKIVGRDSEIKSIIEVFLAQRNLLIEGPVGVGKTVLAQAVSNVLGKKVIRIDGDSRFTEAKLTGSFDPSLVMKKGFVKEAFIYGPLAQAMQEGAILFINELNRMPEAVQNILLPAIDEHRLFIPGLGEIKAKEGFMVVATQNPREFVATSHLSEALMDRMEWLPLNYQSFDEEFEIVKNNLNISDKFFTTQIENYIAKAVMLTRLTREHPKIKRGASIRAAIAILKILKAKIEAHKNLTEEDFWQAVTLALPSRIEISLNELDASFDEQIKVLISELKEELKKKF